MVAREPNGPRFKVSFSCPANASKILAIGWKVPVLERAVCHRELAEAAKGAGLFYLIGDPDPVAENHFASLPRGEYQDQQGYA